MKNGQCSKCGSNSVFFKRNGIVRVVTTPSCGVYINGLSKITYPTDIDVYVCTECGLFEEYISDDVKLSGIREMWTKN